MPLSLFTSLFFAFIILLGIGFLVGFNTSFIILGKHQSKKKLYINNSYLFYFRFIFLRFFPQNEWENSYFCISSTKNILIVLYIFSGAVFFYNSLYLLVILTGLYLFIDFFMRLIATLYPIKTLRFSSPIVSFYLCLFFPINFIFLKIIHFMFNLTHKEEIIDKNVLIKQKIQEILSDTQKHLDPYDQKLISSFITFRQRVSREIMIPRIDLCTLKSDTTIKQASYYFLKEGYSRMPVYKNSLDQIIGVVLYKDIFKVYSELQESEIKLSTPVEKIIKPVIYAPESKKISYLLQEFKAKQIHLAIIVNEYGGTEGIVTIEDILEELVGEIEDEYDIEEDQKFWKLPEGSFVINAKMSIVDIEEQLNITIPSHPEYETIGGFVFHKAGTIPRKGWSIHLDEFQLEVLSSDDRSIKKILIIPTNPLS